MKRYFLSLVLLFVGPVAIANQPENNLQIGYDHGIPIYFTPGFYTLADGVAEAQRTGKYVLVLYDALEPKHSGQLFVCINFDQGAKMTEALAKLSERCVIVRLDPSASRDEYFRFRGYPQFLVMDSMGKVFAGQSNHNQLPDLVWQLARLEQAAQMFAQDIDSALEQAKEQDKPVLVNVYSSDPRSFASSDETAYLGEVVDTLPKLPDATVLGDARNLAALSDPAVVRCVQENFVACEIEGFQERGFMQYYQVFGYPTLLFFTPDGEEIARLQGTVKPGQILATASEVLTRYRQGEIVEPFIPWEDPWVAFERAERENKPVFLLRGDPRNILATQQAFRRMHPQALQDLRDHFVYIYLPGTARYISVPISLSSGSDGDKLYIDHQPWIVRVNGKEMPEQCFEYLLKNVYVPIDQIPESLFGRYVAPIKSGLPMQRNARVLNRMVWVGTGLEKFDIRDRFGRRAVYFLDGQQVVNLDCRGGGLGGYEIFVLDPQGEPLLDTYSFEERDCDWNSSPAFYETLIQAALRLWYGEDGFGVRDIGAALLEAQRTGKRVLLCKQSRGARPFETYVLFEELRDALQQFGYIPALINTASWRMVDFPGMGRIPEWRAWMELELWNERLQTSGWPAYCVLASDGSLVGDHTSGCGSVENWIVALRTGGLGVRYARKIQLASQFEQDMIRLQQAVDQGNWDIIDQMRREGKLLCVWDNYWEGPFTLHLRGAPGGGPYIYGSGEGSGGIVLPPELGRRFRDEQLMTPEEIQMMIERAGPLPKGGQRSTNSYGQEVIDVEVKP